MARLVRTVGCYVAVSAAVAALIVLWPAHTENPEGRKP